MLSMDSKTFSRSQFLPPLLAGAAAGTAVDVSLFPLDTIKTRLQSENGFWKAGGFRNIYAGIGPTVLGSAPTAALFFCSYESTKVLLGKASRKPASSRTLATHHMVAAMTGEVIACILRVPVENVKQKSQASRERSSHIYRTILREENIRGLYRGYFSTVIREIPFSVIQFPLWEFLKSEVAIYQERPISPIYSAVCGSVAGAIAAAITTPLDVAKTRIMLAKKGTISAGGNVPTVLGEIYRQTGVKGLFVGLGPRVLWISIGGFVFLGVYEQVKAICLAS
ncbi:S-adenosylmethionine mitochondrial carrier protein [Hypsibius exemplaris]|uniref:S-adenosylmethionine mitochondrial carrier protein n=1 Tax=Hypsibius exemplaris TaxID=2072580 RepID=A0A1W0X9N8_HYPEX|nr:S-adenosylmethionine mitochondrial carrier protein [Hypsibius exemplaris]